MLKNFAALPEKRGRYRDNQQRGQEVVDVVQQEALGGAKLPLHADGARNLRKDADRCLQERVGWKTETFIQRPNLFTPLQLR